MKKLALFTTIALSICAMQSCSNSGADSKSQMTDEERVARNEAIADSIALSKEAEADSSKEVSSNNAFAQPAFIEQGKFKAGRNLAYYLPITIKNVSNQKIIGVVLERTGKGLSNPIYVGKFPVSIAVGKSVKMRLTMAQLHAGEEELYSPDGLGNIRFMNVQIRQIIFADGSMKRLFNFNLDLEQ